MDETNQRDNTIIIFLSDNGAYQEGGNGFGKAWANACNTPFRFYKHYVHEGGSCTPMIVSWPAAINKANQGTFYRGISTLPNIMATCIDLAETTYPDNLHPCLGKSFRSVAKGSDDQLHSEPQFWEHEGNAAVRWGKWKLVRRYKKPWELYDISSDRSELNDLAETETTKRDEMISLWNEWAKSHGVAFPERFDMYQFLKKKK